MPFLELHLRLKQTEQPSIEAALEEIGALSVTLMDAEDVPILEPGPGETPLWPDIILTALFPIEQEPIELLIALDANVPRHVLDRAKFSRLDDRDWTRAWLDSFKPMQFGRRTWIYPSTEEPPADLHGAIVPGLAFGTGTHPTTDLCLRWLDSLEWNGEPIIDFGCGSGILAIAAIKLGASHAYCIDNDPQALTATRDNALRNGVLDKITVLRADDPLPPPCPRLIANILLKPLLQLAPQLCALTLPGGAAAFSGMLKGQEDEFRPRYAVAFGDLSLVQKEDWICLAGNRRSDS
jgi:ribosomal protein L11 methyltransferase